jgi:signal transduction histidine kinase
VFRFLAWLHGLLFRLCLWALRLPFKAVLAAVTLVVAWLGEEFRRWAGLAVSGVVLVLAGKAVLNYAPADLKRPLVLTVLVLLGIWALAVARAARYTRFLIRSNLQPVRTRQTFRHLFGEVRGLGGRVETLRDGLGRRARGTPIEGAWRSNRQRRADEQAAAEAAAIRDERQRAAEAAWEQAVAAKRAERERFAAAARARWTEQGG